ncbi:MAG TPA: hypothetical protein VH255_10470 [Verrucomicrobiae bacterium]|nr:hypothetical protein [Verrucomicrobiae bacterium]
MTRTNQMKAGRAEAKTRDGAPRRWAAFTLLELLVVIGIIALLAALLVPLTALAVAKMKLSRAAVELTDLATVIQNYKETKGFYPPDNPNDVTQPPLFYELNGTIFDPVAQTYRPMYNTNLGITAIPAANLPLEFGVQGFVNTTQNPADNPVFSHNFSPSQFTDDTNSTLLIKYKILVCPIVHLDGTINPYNYNSTNPTNNPNTFDLWVDIISRGKTNRVCNWSVKPIVL